MDELKEPDHARVSTTPPFQPKASEVYVLSLDEHTRNDWWCDGYTWKATAWHTSLSGERSKVNKVLSLPLKRRWTAKLPVHEAWIQFSSQSLDFVIVHYIGNEQAYSAINHGNRTRGDVEHLRTAPSSLQTIRCELQTRTPIHRPAWNLFKVGMLQSKAFWIRETRNKSATSQPKLAKKPISHDALYAALF